MQSEFSAELEEWEDDTSLIGDGAMREASVSGKDDDEREDMQA